MMRKVLLMAPAISVHKQFNNSCIGALKKLMCDIHLVTNVLDDNDIIYYKQQGITLHNIPFTRSSFIKNSLLIKSLRKLLRKEKFDLVHCHTETGGFITRLSMSADKKAIYIFTPHGMSFYIGSGMKSWLAYYPVERWICRKMSANVGMNKEEYHFLKKWNENTANYIHGTGLDVDKIKSTEVDFAKKRRELNVPENVKLIVSAGELNENKNHKAILNILGDLEDRNVFYIICGIGGLEAELKALCRQKNIDKRVIFLGYRDDIYEILKIADAYVFPSFHEGLSLSLMEAMSAGLPVVCSKIRGNIDLIENNEGGFLCDPSDSDAFLKAISEVLNSEDLRKKMGEINMAKIDKFDISAVENEMLSIYKRVVGD